MKFDSFTGQADYGPNPYVANVGQMAMRNPNFRQRVMQGDTIFVPAGTWHNIVNAGRIPLRLTSIYAPPHHPRGTIHRTKGEAQKEE